MNELVHGMTRQHPIRTRVFVFDSPKLERHTALHMCILYIILSPKCDVIPLLTVTECGPLSPVAHAIATVTGQSYLSVVEYKCKEGHRHTSGALKRTCQADQRWSGATPTCTGKTVVAPR